MSRANSSPPTKYAIQPKSGLQIGMPLKSVLLAGHLRVVSALAGATEVVTGLMANARPEAEDGARAVGLFLNTTPLRAELLWATAGLLGNITDSTIIAFGGGVGTFQAAGNVASGPGAAAYLLANGNIDTFSVGRRKLFSSPGLPYHSPRIW